MKGKHLFTSEAVGMGHPDKVCDQVSDAVLDAFIGQDPNSRVACETLVTTGIVVVAGEITSKGYVEIPDVVREMVKEIGYTDAAMGFDYRSCGVVNLVHGQSPDISQGVTVGEGLHKDQGAGDQGIMFGYACTETPELMPLPITVSHQLMQKINELRATKTIPYLRPDAKSQVTVEYDGDKPIRIDTVVLSTQHGPDVTHEQIVKDITEQLIMPVLPAELVTDDLTIHVNPTGRFEIGGPHGDSGVTGRKIIVDTYGGKGSHGGGAFSGKDPSKVDRSGTYFARYIAKNVVAAGLADRCEVQLAYAIGVAEPVSALVDTDGTGKVSDEKISALVREHFDMRPQAMIETLDLLRPIYRQTSKHGHFGHTGDAFTWERTDKADALKAAAGL